MEKIIITIREAAKIAGVEERTVKQWATVQGFPVLPRRKGQTYRIPKEPFIKWLEGGK